MAVNIVEQKGIGAIPSLPDDLKKIEHDLALLRNFIAKNMQEGVDYGWLPFQDKKKDKASLFKPGAEKLTFYHQCAPRFEIIKEIEDWDKPFFYYRFRCKLIHLPTGKIVGEGEGSCNSMSEKYRYRWVFENELPQDVLKEQLKTKRVKGKDGKYYTMYRIEYEDIASLANTILKMALKSAHIDASLRTFRASWYFTQDIEDMGARIIDADYEVEKPSQKEPSQEEKEPLATAKDIQKFHALLSDLEKTAEQIGENIDKERVKSKFKEACKVTSTKEMTKKQIEKCIAKLEKEIEVRREKIAQDLDEEANELYGEEEQGEEIEYKVGEEE